MKFPIMKKVIFALSLLSIFANLFAQSVTIPISTENSTMVLETDRDKRLRTVYFGKALQDAGEYALVSEGNQYYDANAGIYNAAYTPAGTWNV